MRQALALSAVLVALLASSAAGAAAPTLPGIYTTKITGKQPAALDGEWALEIKRTGAYLVLKRVSKTEGKIEVKGKALLNRNRIITFRKETGPLACKVAGKYRWTRAGKKLTFERLHDTCVGRRLLLSGTFRKVA